MAKEKLSGGGLGLINWIRTEAGKIININRPPNPHKYSGLVDLEALHEVHHLTAQEIYEKLCALPEPSRTALFNDVFHYLLNLDEKKAAELIGLCSSWPPSTDL